MSGGIDDFDLSLDDFAARVNADLVGKITNLASRGAQMLCKKLDGTLGEMDVAGSALVKLAQSKSEVIAEHFENRDFSKGLGEIRFLADEANRYFDEKAPWKTLSENPTETRKVLSSTLNLFRIISIYLKPILPSYIKKVELLFNQEFTSWEMVNTVLINHKMKDFTHLATRVDVEKIQAIIEDSKPLPQPVEIPSIAPKSETKPDAPEGDSSTIEITDFEKIDLRVALIEAAEAIPEAQKLLRLTLDLGPLGKRQVFAGIKAAYEPESLRGKLTVMVANLKPRKMKFGMSEGMVLAAGNENGLYILNPDNGARPGDKVK
jgi:methionyl-tRNA synthetase